METADFLLEIGVEELPHGYLDGSRNSLQLAFEKKLTHLTLGYESIEAYSTPRRLTLFIKGLDKKQKDHQIYRKGPLSAAAFKDGNITSVGEGFFRSCGVSDFPKLENILEKKVLAGVFCQEDHGKVFLYHASKKKSEHTGVLLEQFLPEILKSLPFPKSMRWADLEVAFYRPVKWLLCLLGKEIIPFEFARIVAGNKSFGHRQLSPKAGFFVTTENYIETLEDKGVFLDQERRKEKILHQIENLEKETASLVTPAFKKKLLPKVTNLVEYPHAVCCEFDEEFLNLPEEVLISEMVEHQLYFPLHKKDDSLSNQFIVIANINNTLNVKKGNEKVLVSRLRDGKFLYEQDLEIGLSVMGEKLKTITYQKDLGSYADKVARTKSLAKFLCRSQNLDKSEAPSAYEPGVLKVISLCKNDLASNMVYEFPTLQGIMGGYYAREEGLSLEESAAIPEHYLPTSPNGKLPSGKLSSMVALTDKWETIFSCFSIGIIPTGSHDPYALRRMAFGIIRIIIENKMFFSLKKFLKKKTNIYQDFLNRGRHFESEDLYRAAILHFITNRTKSHFKEYNFSPDVIEASVGKEVDDIYVSFMKASSVTKLKEQPFFTECTEMIKRIKNILREEKVLGSPSPELFEKSAEKDLYDFYQKIKNNIESHINNNEFSKAFLEFKEISQVLGNFFDNVLVNVENKAVRLNRLRLLNLINKLVGNVLDFDKLIT